MYVNFQIKIFFIHFTNFLFFASLWTVCPFTNKNAIFRSSPDSLYLPFLIKLFFVYCTYFFLFSADLWAVCPCFIITLMKCYISIFSWHVEELLCLETCQVSKRCQSLVLHWTSQPRGDNKMVWQLRNKQASYSSINHLTIYM